MNMTEKMTFPTQTKQTEKKVKPNRGKKIGCVVKLLSKISKVSHGRPGYRPPHLPSSLSLTLPFSYLFISPQQTVKTYISLEATPVSRPGEAPASSRGREPQGKRPYPGCGLRASGAGCAGALLGLRYSLSPILGRGVDDKDC